MEWKITNVNKYCQGLIIFIIKKSKIIYQDAHSGNILYENEFDIVISDLEISSSIDNDDDEIYGIISYMAPEILQQKSTLWLQIFIVFVWLCGS